MSFLSRFFNSRGKKRLEKQENSLNMNEELEFAATEEFEDNHSEEPFYHYGEEEQDKEFTEDQEEEYEVVEREILPAKIICPDCGGITLEGLEFCDKCGGEL